MTINLEKICIRLNIAKPRIPSTIGLGWSKIVKGALKDMIAAGWDKDLHQVKEKFCGLRIYIGSSTPVIDSIISKAESAANKICETCGGVREQQGFGLGRAACNRCLGK